ncbi:MAG: phenylalanine--tRNA ligase subunit alpha, partial [Armatimonadota bacterium]
MELQETIDEIREVAESAIFGASDLEELEQVRVKYLGRSGVVREQYSKIGQLPEEDRPLAGQALNKLNGTLERLLEGRKKALVEQAEQAQLAAETVDVTQPGRVPVIGRKHPLLKTMDDMLEIFMGMGFLMVEGPEIEDYYHSFDALNYPEYHPAMDEQDTFYVTDDVLLRSQTSTVQIRVMEETQPPVRIVAPGRCYRRDTVDATHSHTFYQLEGLLVAEDITFADLKGTLAIFAQTMYGEQ